MCKELTNLSRSAERIGVLNARDVVRVLCTNCERTDTCAAVSIDEFDRRDAAGNREVGPG